MRSRAVANSACLIALGEIGKRDLLNGVFESVTAPPAVNAEVGRSIPWLQIRAPVDRALVLALETQLGDGEAEAIALAVELGDVEVILDDRKARGIARKMGLKVVGTLGLLVRAKRVGFIAAVKPLIDELEQAGFRMTADLRLQTLELAGEG